MTKIKLRSKSPPSRLELSSFNGQLVHNEPGINWSFVASAMMTKLDESGFTLGTLIRQLSMPQLFNDGMDPDNIGYFENPLTKAPWDTHIVGPEAQSKRSLAGTGFGTIATAFVLALMGDLGLRVPIALGNFGARVSFRHRVLNKLDQHREVPSPAPVPAVRRDDRLHESLHSMMRGLSENERLYINQAMATITASE